MQLRKGYVQIHHSLAVELIELAKKNSVGKREVERRLDTIKSRIRNKNQLFLKSTEEYSQESISVFTNPSNSQRTLDFNIAVARKVSILACNIGKLVKFTWNGFDCKGKIVGRSRKSKQFIIVDIVESAGNYMSVPEYPKRINVYIGILDRDEHSNIIFE